MTTALHNPSLEIASRLDNGAWVLDTKPGNVRYGETIVLGFHSGAGAVHPFAVWVVRPDGICLHGDYHSTLLAAYAAFAAR